MTKGQADHAGSAQEHSTALDHNHEVTYDDCSAHARPRQPRARPAPQRVNTSWQSSTLSAAREYESQILRGETLV